MRPLATARLRLERLEDRTAPAVVNWTLGANGAFAVAANWIVEGTSPAVHRVPGPTDDVIIPQQYVVTSSVSQAVNSIAPFPDQPVNSNTLTINGSRLQILGGTFTINAVGKHSELGPLTVAGGAALSVAGGNQPVAILACDIAGTLNVATGGTLRFQDGANNLNAGTSLTGPGQFVIEGYYAGTFPTVVHSPTVTLNTPITAPANMVLRFGTINGPSTLTIPAGATLNWNPPAGVNTSAMVGPGVTAVQPGGTLLIGGQDAGVTLANRTISNAGTVTHQGSNTVVSLSGTAKIDNLASGTIRFSSDSYLLPLYASDATPQIANAGTIIVTSPTGTGTVRLDLRVNNAGTVAVQSGTLWLFGNGTHSGAFNVTGGTLEFSGGGGSSQVLNAGTTFPGPGLVRLPDISGELVVNAPVSMPNFSQSSGTLRGSGTLTLTRTATWTGGVMSGTGTTAVAIGATLTLPANPSGNGLPTVSEGRTLEVFGTVNHTGTGEFNLGGPAGTLTIRPGGVYNLTADADISVSGSAVNNAGLFVKSSSTGTGTSNIFIFQAAFNNTGTVRVDSGTLALRNNGGTHTGAFNVAAGATLSFAGTSTNLNAGVTFPGAGLVSLVSPGELVVNALVSFPNFSQSGGTLRGSGTVTLSKTAVWTGGDMSDDGTTAVPAGATLTLPGPDGKSLGPLRQLSNAGTVNHTGTGALAGGVLTNQAGGTYNLVADADLGTVLNNAGLFVKSGAGTSFVNPAINNSGTLRLDRGTLTQSYADSFTQTAGSTIVAAGATLNTFTVQLSGGVLGGNGTVAGNVTGSGSVSPGASPGRLTVNGDAALGGPLAVELNGSTAGTQYDQLKVNGTVALSGALSLTLGFSPSAGTAFTVIDNDDTDALMGTFAGLPQGATITAGGTTFRIDYAGGSGNDVVLTAVAAPPRVTGTQVNGGAAQRSMVKSISVTFSTIVGLPASIASAFTLARIGGGLVTSGSATTATVSGATVVTLSGFSGAEASPGGSLNDGRYTLTALAASITANGLQLDGNGDGTAGDNFVFADSGAATGNQLYRFFGDITGDRFVNGSDFALFRTAFGSSSGNANYNAAFDVNGDGFVNGSDFAVFRTNFGGSV